MPDLIQDLVAEAMALPADQHIRNAEGAVVRAIPGASAPFAQRILSLNSTQNVAPQSRALSATELRQRKIIGRVTTLPHPANDNAKRDLLPTGTNVGSMNRVGPAVLERSLVAAAGASIIVVPTAPAGSFSDEGAPVQVLRKSKYLHISPVSLAVVADGADVPTTTVPVVAADIDVESAPTIAVAFELSRRQIKDLSEAATSGAIMSAVMDGLANAVDRTLLGLLKASNLDTFTVGEAAASGVRWGQLSAIAGLDAGVTTTVDATGTLRVSGVAAELTDQVNGTFVGDFDRAAVAVYEDIRLIALRQKNGACRITVMANLQPLVADLSAFWKAGA